MVGEETLGGDADTVSDPDDIGRHQAGSMLRLVNRLATGNQIFLAIPGHLANNHRP